MIIHILCMYTKNNTTAVFSFSINVPGSTFISGSSSMFLKVFYLPSLAYLLNQMSPLHLSLPPPGPPYDYDIANVSTVSYTASTIWNYFIYVSFICYFKYIRFLLFSVSYWQHFCLFVLFSYPFYCKFGFLWERYVIMYLIFCF